MKSPIHFETKIAETEWGIQKVSHLSDNDMHSVIAHFPKSRYYGSKRRLLGWIYHALKDLPFNTVLDGFGGTARVSLLFKIMGKQLELQNGFESI